MAQVTVNDLETIDKVPVVQAFGFASNPPNGSDVALVFVGGDRSNGVVVATNSQKYRVRNLAPGESAIYTQDGKQIYLTADGGIKIAANGQPVEIDSATTVTINASNSVVMNTPLLKVSGDIIDNYETNESTIKELRTAYDGHDHDVVEVQMGSSTITTSGPNSTV